MECHTITEEELYELGKNRQQVSDAHERLDTFLVPKRDNDGNVLTLAGRINALAHKRDRKNVFYVRFMGTFSDAAPFDRHVVFEAPGPTTAVYHALVTAYEDYVKAGHGLRNVTVGTYNLARIDHKDALLHTNVFGFYSYPCGEVEAEMRRYKAKKEDAEKTRPEYP
jgi:hypothetical protein